MRRRLSAAALTTVLLAVLLFSLLYFCDNKYNTATPQPRNGLLLLSETTLSEYPVLFLVNGWEIYPGLLTPEELHTDPYRSGKPVFIGQYTGFDLGNAQAGRHGSATLVLNIAAPEMSRTYALELPEIYSAYKLYINGEQVFQMGEPDSVGYKPETGNRMVTFTASGNTELVLAMSDYAHSYSGLVYPPAFGEPSAVQQLLALRLAIRSGAAVLALFLGFFFLTVGLVLRRRLPDEADENNAVLLYGLMCLCFLGYASYPVMKTIGFGGLGWYTLEQFSYLAMLLILTLLMNRLCGYRGGAAKVFPAVGAVMTACALFTPLLSQGPLPLLRLWSWLIGVWFILCALYLTAVALWGLLRGHIQSPVMLCGALVFDTALVMDRILPDFEPICTGWFTEWAGAALVALTGVLIAQNIFMQYRQRRLLQANVDNMHRLMEAQAAYYPLVLEQAQGARAARHDLRHHMRALRSLAAQRDLDGLDAYLEAYDPIPDQPATVFCEHAVLNTLLSHYAALAEAAQVRFTAHAEISATLWVTDPDLFAIVANLLENAFEAAEKLPPEQRFIEAGIRLVPGSLAVTVDNAFDGLIAERNGRLVSRKRVGQPGIGTASVERIARQYGGNAAYHFEQTERGHLFHAGVILPVPQEG